MNALIQGVKNFWNDEEGVTAVEYALVVALMAAAIVAAWPTLTAALGASFGGIATSLGASS